ncbi:hypothetical protein HMP09_0393 [Sphingomonas sp. HMP9]|nr:hypothetical protein HMP09_0393 [Sphingomonas sp. HMP9]
MEPYVKAAKTHPILPQAEINNFGWKCASELKKAAELRDDFWWSEPMEHDYDPVLLLPNRASRIRWHECDLAGTFYCKLRYCQLTD